MVECPNITNSRLQPALNICRINRRAPCTGTVTVMLQRKLKVSG
jgi:hypothetical protein